MKVYVLTIEWHGQSPADGRDDTQVVGVFSSVSAACRATEFPEELWEKEDDSQPYYTSPKGGEFYERYWYEIREHSVKS